jgi:hypothetical protein
VERHILEDAGDMCALLDLFMTIFEVKNKKNIGRF